MKPVAKQVGKYLLLFFILSLVFKTRSSAQQFLTTINGWNAYVHLPDDYNVTAKLYPVIVFLPGIGEVGSDPSKLLVYGPSRFISQGHNMQFMVNGVLEKPIVISMQPPAAWPAPLYLNRQIDSIFARWRIDTDRLALTGLSMGGSGWDNYTAANSTYWTRPASIVPMSAPPPATPVTNFSYYALSGGKWWGFEGTQDYRQMDVIRDIMNAAVPGSAKYTLYVGGHCCWNTWYNPSWNENGESIYTWMLKQRRNSTPTTNNSPVANAGNNQNITLPTNSVTLNGSGTDNDGTIAAYQWTKITGPAQFSIATPATAQTTVSNLVQGVYSFRLLVTDDDGATDADTVTVTVNAAPNQPPAANAGNNQNITLPTNSVTLNGSGTDNDGTITAYQWTKIAGPAQFSIATPATAQTTVSNLVQGVYSFRLLVTDDDGATDADTVTVTVNAAPNQPPVANAGNNQNITLPTNSVTLNGSGTDNDGTIAAYQWTKIAGPAQFSIATPATAQTTVSNLVQGVYSFRLLVTDDDGATDADTVTVTVNAAPNQPPVANAGNNQNITLPTNSVTLNGSGTDNDGTIAAYQWTKITGPAQFSIATPATAQTTVSNLVQGVYSFRLLVTDDDGATDADTVTVTVNAAPNLPPTANAGNDVTLTLPTNSTMLTGSGSDPDGTITGYVWSRVSGPTTFTLGTANAATTTLSNLVQGVYSFRLLVTDDDGATDADTVTVTVNAAPNQPPVANAGNNQNITLPTNSVTLNGSGTDNDGTITAYQWTKIAGPAQFSIATPATAQTTVSNLVQGVYSFRLLVTDDDGATDADTITVTVNAAPNLPPTANAGSDVTLTLPVNSTTLTGSGSDPDGTIAGYVWSRVSGPTTFTLGTANAATTTLSNLVQGVYSFRLLVTDDDGATDADTVTVTVNAAPNLPPTANAGSDVTLTLPANSTMLTGSGSDPDGTIAGYAWSRVSGPTTFTLGTANAATTTLSNLVQGVYSFRLLVTDDDGATDADTVTVTVNAAPNQPPVANAGNNQNITLPTNSVTLNGSGTDNEGTIAAYQWTKIAGPAQFSIATPATAQTTVSNLVQGVYSFRLLVTDDDGATDADTVTVTVNAAPNQPPVANAGNNQNITLPTNSVTLNGSGTDNDGTITAYQWTKIAGPAQFSIATPATAQTTVSNLVQGVYSFRLLVTDDDGATNADTVTVTVNAAPNQPPVANAGNNQNITLPTNSVTLNGSGTDNDGTIAAYQWTKIAGPAQFSIATPATAQTTVSNLVQGVYSFRLLVTDDDGATDADTVTVTVNAAPNLPPTANAGSDVTLTLPVNSTTLTGSGSDPDGTIAGYAWSRVSGPTTFTLGTANAATTTLSNLVQGVYSFRLLVTDDDGATDADTVTVTVNAAPNQPPVANAGNNQNITLPTNSVTLNGSGTDNEGTIAAYQWTKIAGPAQFSIATPATAQTTVSNLVQGVYSFRLLVTDDDGATDADTVTVTVNAAPNLPPTANAGSDVTLTLPANSTTLTGSGSDPDGTITAYVWSRVSGPTTFTLGTANAATTTLSNLVQGVYSFRLLVTDDDGATDADTVTVTVNAAPNQPPVANAGNNQNITLPTNSVTLNGSGTDNDGTIAAYQWTKIAGPAQFSIATPATAQTTVSNLVQGVYSFRLLVTDDDGATDADTIMVTVNAALNLPPIANAGSDVTLTLPANSTTLTGSGSDPDGTIAGYVWSRVSGPTTFTLGTANAATTTLSNLVQGVYSFRLLVTDDDGATNADTVTVTVNAAPNQPPVANAGNNQNITLPTNSVTLNGSGTDNDGTIAAYQWTKITGPAQFSIATPATAQTTVSNLVQGVYSFRLLVTDDDGATDADTVTVTVNAAPNLPPTANAGNDVTLTLPANSTTLTGSGSDPDGTIAGYVWSRVSGPTTFTLGTANAATTTLSNLVQGVYSFRLLVTDDDGATDADTVTVTVNAAPNQPPVANAGNNQNITLPTNSVTLNGSGTDNDGTIAAYQWTKIAGPAQFSIATPATAQTTVSNLVQGVYSFRLLVTDDDGATDADTVTVTVNAAPNQPPVANAGNNQNITLPTNSVTLNGSGTDNDGTIAAYQWTKITGPAQFSIATPATAQTTVSNLVQGVYSFRLLVTDDDGATDADTVTVTVNAAPNLPPTANAGNDVTLTLPANSTTLTGSGSDPDGTIAGYVWSRVSGPTTFTLGTANAATTTLSNLVQGVYSFRLLVTDDDGATDADTVTVTVNAAPNLSPTANAGSDVTLTLPANSTTLIGSGTDPDGTIVSYAWSSVSGPATFTLSNADAATATLSNLVQGTYVFSLIVTDNSGATATDNVTVTVNAAPNLSPTANAGSDVTLTLPVNSTILIGSGTDPDGTIVSYAWSSVSGPATFTLSNADAATATLSNLVQGTYVFSLIVTDNSGATGTDNVTVTVNAAPNLPPTANAGSDVALTLPANSTTLIGSGTDPDGTIVSYAWSSVSGPATFTLSNADAATATLSNLVQGTYVLSLTVTDNSGATGTDNVTVTVNAAPNLPPTANAGSDVILTLPVNSTTLIGSGSDPDGTIVSYAWSGVSGPATFTLSNADAATATLSNLVQGTYVFSLIVTDNSGATGTDNVTVTVNAAPNLPPTANAGSDVALTLPANSTTLIGSGTDPDGTIVSYAWSSVSGPATFTLSNADAATATLSNLVQGTYVLSLTVTDNSGATGTDNVTVTVNAAPNLPPTANAGSDVTLTLPANSTTLIGSGTDPDGTIVSYAWSSVSGPATFTLSNADAATATLSNLVQGTYVLSLTVTDNSGATGTDNVTVTVNAAPNLPPTANAGSDVTLTLPVNSTTLTGTGSDPDGTIVSYAWSRVSGPTTFTLGTANVVTITLSNLVQGTYVFSLTVTDNSGATGTDNVTITINAAPNLSPTANAGSDVTLTLPVNSTTLIGSGSDPDGTIVNYVWSRESGPTTFTLGSANTGTTTLNNLVQGTYVFALTITDNSGDTATDNVTVTVNAAAPPAPNQPPVANAGPDQTIALPSNSATLYGNTSYDPDGTISSYSWQQISGPGPSTFSSTSASITTVSNLQEGNYIYRLIVKDNGNAADTITVNVTILNNFRIYGPVALYPNPATNVINVVLNTDSAGTVRFNIYNMQGRKVMPAIKVDKPRGFFTATINVSQLRSDTYILEAITSKYTKMMFKFVKL